MIKCSWTVREVEFQASCKDAHCIIDCSLSPIKIRISYLALNLLLQQLTSWTAVYRCFHLSSVANRSQSRRLSFAHEDSRGLRSSSNHCYIVSISRTATQVRVQRRATWAHERPRDRSRVSHVSSRHAHRWTIELGNYNAWYHRYIFDNDVNE